MSQTLGTIRLPYRLFRDTVDQATDGVDTDLTASTKSWANFVTNHHPSSGSGAKAIKLEERDNKAIIVFDFENIDADTAGCTIYGYREGWPAEFICSINTITAGNQESIYPLSATTTRYFADNIGTITQAWIGGSSSVEEVDSAGTANRMAKIKFDTYGVKYLLILFTSISANDSVRAFITFY